MMRTDGSGQTSIPWTPTGLDPATWLGRLGPAFAVFDQQDSGCVSYGLDAPSGRLFVKTSTTPAADSSLRNAWRFHRAVGHPSIVAPLDSYTFPDGRLAIVYPWHDGQVLYPSTPLGPAVRTAPTGPMAAFRAQPVPRILAALDAILRAHVAVCAAGFVAVDLYDGCFLYDADQGVMRLIDLDEYRPGPFAMTTDRLPGSTRFMAPEERRRGAVIDERTTVHALGRTLRLLLDAGDDEQAWRGTDDQLAVIRRATEPEPDRRYATVDALRDAWSRCDGR